MNRLPEGRKTVSNDSKCVLGSGCQIRTCEMYSTIYIYMHDLKANTKLSNKTPLTDI